MHLINKTLSQIFKHETAISGEVTEEYQTVLTINGLPPEILIQIFAYFSLQELNICTLVCKRWHELTQDDFLWKQFCLDHGLPKRESGWYSQFNSFTNAFINGDIIFRIPKVYCRELENIKLGALKRKFYAAASLEKNDTIKIIDLETNELVTSFDKTENLTDIICMDFHDNYLAFSTIQDKESVLKIFGPKESHIEVRIVNFRTIFCHEDVIGAVPEYWLDSAIYLIDPKTGRVRHILPHPGLIGSSIYFSDKRLASGDSNETNRIWDVETGECLHTFHYDGGAHNLLIQKETFISTSHNKVKIHNLHKERSYTFSAHGVIESIDLQENILAMRIDDGSIYLLNIKNKKSSLFKEKRDAASKGRVSAKIKWNGLKLYVVLSNNSLQIWDFTKDSLSKFSKMKALIC